ncbi:MAG TPA: arginase [Pyrinomonadaceae bacterium]|nr:arginase [Pyrinomonadaceae bacterium]
MTEAFVEEKDLKQQVNGGTGRGVGIIGVPMSYGASMAGVDMGPAALRVARLVERLSDLGCEVRDLGDIPVERSRGAAKSEEKLKYLDLIKAVCENLAKQVEQILKAGDLPISLGGDHSIAMGSIAGFAAHCGRQNVTPGLIWFDAHADMNRPDTTPSGNIHGMPLAVVLGYGAPELIEIGGINPKIKPEYCVHIGARDLDAGERELIRRLGLRFITMREIDERGMSACMDDAIKIASAANGGYMVTFDVDVLDPGDAPGSGTLVRGGLTYREAHLAMEKIADDGGLKALEVVEINTALDVNNKTAELGVELILSALGKTIL